MINLSHWHLCKIRYFAQLSVGQINHVSNGSNLIRSQSDRSLSVYWCFRALDSALAIFGIIGVFVSRSDTIDGGIIPHRVLTNAKPPLISTVIPGN